MFGYPFNLKVWILKLKYEIHKFATTNVVQNDFHWLFGNNEYVEQRNNQNIWRNIVNFVSYLFL